jgi:hypothetical protein
MPGVRKEGRNHREHLVGTRSQARAQRSGDPFHNGISYVWLDREIIMKDYIKFACVYCGQHIECGPEFSGRQFHCPACKQRLAVPPPDGSQATRPPASVNQTWDTQVPDPGVETPTR